MHWRLIAGQGGPGLNLKSGWLLKMMRNVRVASLLAALVSGAAGVPLIHDLDRTPATDFRLIDQINQDLNSTWSDFRVFLNPIVNFQLGLNRTALAGWLERMIYLKD